MHTAIIMVTRVHGGIPKSFAVFSVSSINVFLMDDGSGAAVPALVFISTSEKCDADVMMKRK